MALQNGAFERKWMLFKHILLHRIFYLHFYFFVCVNIFFISVVNVTCVFSLRFVWKLGFIIELGFVLSLLLRNLLTKWQTFTPCTTKKMAVVQANSFASHFPSAFLYFFLLGLMLEMKCLGTVLPLLFSFYVLVSSASRAFLDTEMCQSLSVPVSPSN